MRSIIRPHALRLLTALGLAPGAAAAALVFERTTLEAAVDEGGSVRAEFVYRNDGPVPVEIARVETSCTCTAAEAPAGPVDPGAEGRLAVVYRPGSARGPRNETVTVTEADGTEHRLGLRIEVRARATIEPRLLVFRGDEREARSIRVVYGLHTPVSVVGVEFAAPGFELDRPPAGDGVVVTLWIRRAAGAAEGLRAVARLRTRDAQGREHTDNLYLSHRP